MLRQRQELHLGLALDQAVHGLDALEARQPLAGGHPERRGDLPRGEVADPQVEHLALVDQVVERPERLVERGVRIGEVHVVEVDPVRAEAPEAPLDRLPDVAARPAGRVNVALASGAGELGRDDQLVAAVLHQAAEDLLRAPVRVGVRRVEEVDARVPAAREERRRRRVVRVAAEGHGAEAEPRHLDPRAAEDPVRQCDDRPGRQAGTTALIDARTISSTRSICCSVMTSGGAKKICSATVPSGTG